jgi:voltage-gated potassium channel
MHPDIKIVLRMFDDTLASKVERGFGIHTAFSTSGIAAPAFAAAATRAHIDYSFYVGGTLLHVSQINVDAASPLVGLTMEDAERRYNLTVVLHQSGDELHLHPKYSEKIQVNDMLVVFATLETLGQIGGMNHDQHQHNNHGFFRHLIGRRR